MFCSCPADHFAKEPNTLTCPVCLGLPGALPVPNKKAIEWTVLTGLALGCKIPLFSKFDRKNYFYPDLPKGYQISQYDLPFAVNGEQKLKTKNSKLKTIGITRVHLEEDTAKLIHQFGMAKKNYTLIDFNRSGVPLMEIVTEPDLNSTQEVKEFLKKLQQLLRYLGVSDCDMEKGQMRCEPTVNLEIKKNGNSVFTPLVELKNINSFRFVQKAIDYEIQRQREEFEKTGIEKQPGNKTTRGWDEKKQKTVLQREKEEAQDYRYFPEPDIPPIRWRKGEIESLKKSLSELPEKKKKRFVKEYHLSEYEAEIIIKIKGKADYFEKAVKLGKASGLTTKQMANFIINKRIDIKKLLPEEFIQTLVKQQKKAKISDRELIRFIKEVVKENSQAVADFKKGKTTVVEFLVGQVARKTKGQADPNQTRKLLLEKLRK
jgi:aspartyl-tRNA(Asn)/glutamyl-tRNA(Gln) amidotransferase subunit B